MKKVFIAFLILSTIKGSAQIAGKLIQFQPLGDLGMLFSKTISGELMYLEPVEEDETLRRRVGISYISLKPRLDTFPIYGIKEDNGTTVLPGYQVYHKYAMMFLFAGMDYAPIKKKNYSLYAGGDFLFGGIDQEYDHVIETLSSESYSGGTMMIGGRLRIGGEYMFNERLGTFLEATRSFYLYSGGFQSSYDIGIGMHVLFNR